MPTLRVKSGPLAGQTIEVQGDLTIGRQSADITIDDAQPSRRHAVVRLLADGLEVENLGSSNGTFVDGHRCSPLFRLAAEDPSKRFWLGWNELDADELLSIAESHVYDKGSDEEFVLEPGEFGLGASSFDDLLPVTDLDSTVSHFQ